MFDRITVLDLETTGLPQKISFGRCYPPEQTDRYLQSRLVEVGFQQYSLGDHSLLESVSFIVRPQGYAVPDGCLHGITDEQALAQGVPLPVQTLWQMVNSTSVLVCHGANFDQCVRG